MPRIPVKTNLKISEAQTKGRLKAEADFNDKQPLLKKLKRLVWRKLEQIDPLKAVALGATTVLIHGLVLNSEELKEKSLLYISSATLMGLSGLAISYAVQASGLLGADEPKPLKGDNPAYWVTAFVLAYMLVEHGGEITGMLLDGGKSLGNLASSLLA